MVDLNKDVKYIKGVGPNRVLLLNKLGIYTLRRYNYILSKRL